jgi:hypothetical protein
MAYTVKWIVSGKIYSWDMQNSSLDESIKFAAEIFNESTSRMWIEDSNGRTFTYNNSITKKEKMITDEIFWLAETRGIDALPRSYL